MTAWVLVVDDDSFDNERYCQLIESAGYSTMAAFTVEQALVALTARRFDVVLVDMLLPYNAAGKLEFGGIVVLRAAKERDAAVQVIAVTGYGNRDVAAEAMRFGACEYITKDPETEERLVGSVRIAALRAQRIRERLAAPRARRDGVLVAPEQMAADSAAMRQTLRRVQSLAAIDKPLLFVGELGVGKEFLANVAHLNSTQTNGPFIVVDCETTSGSLGEVFGTAANPSAGACARAEGGTLVFTSIQSLSFDQQQRITELVTTQSYTPLGESRPVQGQMRIMATTTADLERLVRQRRFWPGLYDALSVAMIDVPPLRERRDKDDILALAGYLLRNRNWTNAISPEAAEALASHDYTHGNIKELEQILEAAVKRAGSGEIRRHHLPPTLQGNAVQPQSLSSAPAGESVELSIRFVPGDPAMLLWDSHNGSTRSELRMPFDANDLTLILRALDALQWPGYPHDGPPFDETERVVLERAAIWTSGRVRIDCGQHIGKLLYQALIADHGGRSAIESIRNLATERERPLALMLRFPPDAIALAALPWELLWDDRQPLLFSSAKVASCVRHLDLPQAIPPTPVIGRKLRLLAICPAAGIPDELHAEETRLRTIALQPLVDAGALEMEVLRPARIGDLTDRLQDGDAVDIIHFYGHGLWQDGQGYLQFDDGVLNANQFATLAGNVPLVVLHACRSGTTGPDDLFTGIAPMLSAEGVSAVVAMQFTVGVDVANRFATVFYRNLARGESVQKAVAKARHALYMQYPQSWFVPVVYIRSRDPGPLVMVRQTLDR